MNKKGFTLAEVLITLAIIGVVAALTIPSVARNYQNQEIISRFKKTYSALANTTNLAIAEYGPVETWELGTPLIGSSAEQFVNTYMIPYLKVSKNCGSTNSAGDCNRYTDGTWARFYLTDGTFLRVGISADNYAWVHVDINGARKPNKTGRDVFEFKYYIKNAGASTGKFVPACFYCSREDLINDPNWGCNKNASGHYCTALIMRDGWQIKDDYFK